MEFHPGVDGGQGRGLEVEEAGRGEPHHNPFAGQVLRLVERRQAVFQALFRLDDVGGPEALEAAGRAPELEQEPPFPVQGDPEASPRQVAGLETPVPRGLLVAEGAEAQERQEAALVQTHQGQPPVNAVRIGVAFDVSQRGRGLEQRRNGGGHAPVGGQVRGRGTLDGNGGPAQHRLGLGIGPLVLPGEEKG